jgi:hypothetical protein
MTMLNGGLTKARLIPAMSEAEFLAHYLSSMTLDERRTIAQLPAIPRRTVLACVLSEIRCWPLPPDHPLNPAARYEATK